MRRVVLALLIAAVAVAEDDKKLKQDHAPTPYTAAQIRDACKEGRTSTFLLENPRAAIKQTFRFTKCDQKGTDLVVTQATKEGKALGEPGTSRSTWKQLQAHGSYPESQTKITEASTTTPAGKFDCWLYTVTKKEGEKTTVLRAYFAKKLPGPPVLLKSEVDGKPALTMTLIAHTPGK